MIVTRDDGTASTEVCYEYDAAGNRKKREVGSCGSTGGGSGGGGTPPSNNSPVAVNDSVTVSLYSLTYLTVTANDSDPDGDPLTISAVTQPSNGFVVIQTASVVQIFATSSGGGVFTYTISDGNGGTDTAVVNFNVTGGGGGFPL